MVMGLMFDSSCHMLGTTYINPGDLYAIDPFGAATLIGSTGLDNPHGGSIRTFVPDALAPRTTDNVPTAFRNAPVRVTLSAADSGGSGVAHTYYTIGVNPPAPTATSSVYDAAHKPALADGQRIRYFSVDARGNAETARLSAPARVDTQAPTTRDDVPVRSQKRPVAVTLAATDNPTSSGHFAGVAAIYYETGVNPATPTTASRRYDPAHKPVLTRGQRIRYLAVDNVGNAETARTSRPAHVRFSRRHVRIHIRKRYHGHAVRAVRAKIDGHKAKVRRTHGGYVLVVDMRGHSCTPVKVRIRVVLKKAHAMTQRRTFHTCGAGRR
jgi:hypothetical protein